MTFSEALYHAMEQISEGIAYLDAKGHYLYVNEAYALINGYFPEEMPGLSWLVTVAPEEHPFVVDGYSRMQAVGKVSAEVRGIRKDGSSFYKEASVVQDSDAQGNFVGHYVFIRDITARKEAQFALHESEKRFRSAMLAMHEGLLLYNEQTQISFFNPQAEHILGLTADQLLGRAPVDPVWQLIQEDGSHYPSDQRPVIIALRDGRSVQGAILGIRKPTGERTWVSANAVPLFRTGESVPSSAVVTFTDITERKWFEETIERQITYTNEMNLQLHQQQAELELANRRLQELATTDGLTGLENHRAFQEKLSEEFRRSQRYASALSLLLLDVDHFKAFNDSFGHPAGDGVLKRIGRVLQDVSRGMDFVARYGGEEFVLVLPTTDQESALHVAERILITCASQPWEHRPITVSIGLAALKPDIETPSELLGHADRVLYRAKKEGRNRVWVWSP